MCGAKFRTWINSLTPSNEVGATIPIVQMGKLRHRAFRLLVYDWAQSVCLAFPLCCCTPSRDTEGTYLALCSLLGLWKSRPRAGREPIPPWLSLPPQAPTLCPSGVLDPALPGVTLICVAPAESQQRLPMHHRVAVTPEPACHFHPSFSNRFLSGSEGGQAGVGVGRGRGEDGWGGG